MDHDSAKTWPGVLDREALHPKAVAAIDTLADAARDGRWAQVFAVLDKEAWRIGPNQFRVGGRSWFSPLHQAAWHGAPAAVVADLVGRGAWRTLREAAGRRPVDIARERGHDHLVEPLLPPAGDHDAAAWFAAVDRNLEAVVDGRIRPQLTVRLRPVSTEVLTELGRDPLWFPVPGMYGGFSLRLFEGHVEASSWIRVVGGSGQRHVVTAGGAELVEEGFV